MDTLVNIGFYITYALFGVAILAVAYFSIYQFISTITKSKTSLIALGAMVVILVVSYLLSSPTDVPQSLLDKAGLDAANSTWIGTGMVAFYILLGITVVSLIGSEIARPFKK